MLEVNRQSYLFNSHNDLMSTFGERLREARKNKKLSQGQLAKLVGVKQPTISELESEGKGSSNTALIAKVLGVSPIWLSEGKGDKELKSGEYDLGIAIDLHANDDYPSIRRVSLKLSAGITGYAIESDIDDKTPLVFSKNWFTRNGYNPRALLAVQVAGESMQPSLYDGDTVTINTADTTPKDGEVFAINYEGELLIKRLVRDDGIWWLSSDNSDQRKYARKKCEGDVCIILGKIVHKQSERI